MSEALTKEAQTALPQLAGLSAGFYLAGGTGLGLQINHRISVDFDFFSEKKIPKKLLETIERHFSGKQAAVQVNNPEELTLTLDGIKLTFLYYPFPVLGRLIDYKGLKLLNVPEIGAAKAYSLGRRATYKDYVDLYFILSGRHTSLEEIIKLSQRKYREQFEPRLFLEQLVYLKDIIDTEIEFLKKPIDKQQLEEYFRQEIKKLNL